MERCGACVYYLRFKSTGFNCGYLVKRVSCDAGSCRYFESLRPRADDDHRQCR